MSCGDTDYLEPGTSQVSPHVDRCYGAFCESIEARGIMSTVNEPHTRPAIVSCGRNALSLVNRTGNYSIPGNHRET